MSRFLSRFLVSLSILAVFICNNSLAFSDLPGTHWAKLYIDNIYSKGLLEGYPDGTIKPNEQLTRAEACKIVSKYIKMSNYDSENYGNDGENIVISFSDVGGWSSEYINHLVSLEVISGYPDGTFKPNKFITRAEFTTLMYKFLDHINELDTTLEGYKGHFDDISNHWAKDYINSLHYLGYVNGYKDPQSLHATHFKPNAIITRAETCIMLSNMDSFEPKYGSDTIYTAGVDIPVGEFKIYSNSRDFESNIASFMVSTDSFNTTRVKENFKGNTYITLEHGESIVFYDSYMLKFDSVLDSKLKTKGFIHEGMYRIGYDFPATRFNTYSYYIDKPIQFEFFKDSRHTPESLIDVDHIYGHDSHEFTADKEGLYLQISNGDLSDFDKPTDPIIK